MQGKAAEAANFYTVTVSQGRAHLLENGFDTEFHVDVCEVALQLCQAINEF